MTPPSFPHLLQAFFQDWLAGQRNLSRYTLLSYRDTWRLFLRFVAARKARAVAQLGLTDLTEAEVLAFLRHCEDDRHTSIGTRNCRLAALRAFFCFVADREPTVAADCAAILRIPTKRTSQPALCYLDADEVTAILDQPDRSSAEGQRDHVLLSFLYNTGARIQEALNVCPGALRLDPPTQVRLFGKGCHAYCTSFRRRSETTGTHAGRQACDLAFSAADVLPVVRRGIGVGPCTDAHGAGRVAPMSEPWAA